MKKMKLLLVSLLLTWGFTACNKEDVNGPDNPGGKDPEVIVTPGEGVFILNEGNMNAGNASLSYYNPKTKEVQNGVFLRVNDRKLGDVGQSLTLHENTVFIAVENSGIIWGIDKDNFKVKGQLEANGTNIINPRYVHVVNAEKAYVTDLYSPNINIFSPKDLKYKGSISLESANLNEQNFGYYSTEEMVQYGDYVYVVCWSYSRKILVIDTKTDKLAGEIVLTSWQPKSIRVDKNGKLWVITDGGYSYGSTSFSDNVPHLYRIDAATRKIELDQALDTDKANVQIEMNGAKDKLYIINNDIYCMSITDAHPPVRPIIEARTDSKGEKNKLYAVGVDPKNGDIYVADAVDYQQSGMIYRYDVKGELIDAFRVGINPNHFCFK